MTHRDADQSGDSSALALQPTTKAELLSLLDGESAATPVVRMREALEASPETSLRLARGTPAALSRTYSARLRDAQAQGLPTVGIQALLDALDQYPQEHLWGFTVRDNTMIYVGFADADLTRLIGVVIIARTGAERMMAS